MDQQFINNCVSLVKVDLGITTTAYDTRLEQIVEAAIQAITEEGISLSSDAIDLQLCVMYSAWLWNKRRNGEGMPRMLRYQLNNRLFGQKMRGGTDG